MLLRNVHRCPGQIEGLAGNRTAQGTERPQWSQWSQWHQWLCELSADEFSAGGEKAGDPLAIVEACGRSLQRTLRGRTISLRWQRWDLKKAFGARLHCA